MKKILIYGNPEDVPNYIKAFEQLGAEVLVTRDDSRCAECDALLLPGGGDVYPALYGQEINGSHEPNHVRDAEEFRFIARFLALDRPILGICRGLQVLNVAFGGTLHQHISGHSQMDSKDTVHMTKADDPILCGLYGNEFPVNSAHHQVIDRLGVGLQAVQWSGDGYVEAIRHHTRPVFAVQWHPERTCFDFARPDTVDGSLLLRAFIDQI